MVYRLTQPAATTSGSGAVGGTVVWGSQTGNRGYTSARCSPTSSRRSALWPTTRAGGAWTYSPIDGSPAATTTPTTREPMLSWSSTQQPTGDLSPASL